GSDDFKARETAQIELANIAKQHPGESLDTLLKEYLNSSVPEARYRLRSILYSTKQAEYMKVPRGFVGIVMYPRSARGADGQIINTVQVRSVVSGSAADRHGLQVADQIVSIDGRTFGAIDPLEEFAGYVTGKRRGDEVDLVVIRQAEEKKIKLTLGQRPPDLIGQDYRAQERFERDFKTWLDESAERLKE
ncbi:MAG: PDZ domain-containing protein, partial [Verrucomicrobiales bacterium]